MNKVLKGLLYLLNVCTVCTNSLLQNGQPVRLKKAGTHHICASPCWYTFSYIPWVYSPCSLSVCADLKSLQADCIQLQVEKFTNGSANICVEFVIQSHKETAHSSMINFLWRKHAGLSEHPCCYINFWPFLCPSWWLLQSFWISSMKSIPWDEISSAWATFTNSIEYSVQCVPSSLPSLCRLKPQCWAVLEDILPEFFIEYASLLICF